MSKKGPLCSGLEGAFVEECGGGRGQLPTPRLGTGSWFGALFEHVEIEPYLSNKIRSPGGVCGWTDHERGRKK